MAGKNHRSTLLAHAFGVLAALGASSYVSVCRAADEIFVANWANNTITVYPRTTTGDVAPVRSIKTGLDHPHTLAIDPLHRELFVSNSVDESSLPAINVYDWGAEFPGSDTPKRTISGWLTGLTRPAGLAVDVVNQELFVANDLGSGASITVYPLAANGNVAPLRTLQGPLTALGGPLGMAVDFVHDELLVSNYQVSYEGSVTVYSRTATGDSAPLRTIQGPHTGLNTPQGLALDLARDEIVVANSAFTSPARGSVIVYPRLASGDANPIREIAGAGTGLCNPIGVVLDPRNERLLVANSHFGSGDCSEAVTTYARTAHDDAAPLLMVGPGPLSALAHPTSVAVTTSVRCPVPATFNGAQCVIRRNRGQEASQ